MKNLALIAALASASLLPFSTQAQTATSPFNVTVAFTPSCTLTTAVRNIAFTYTALAVAPAAQTVSNPVVLSCSRGIGAAATAAYDGGVAAGLIGTTNLRYTLSLPAKTVTPGLPATGVAGGVIGTPETVSFSFTGTLLSQAGAGINSTLVNVTVVRSLIVSF